MPILVLAAIPAGLAAGPRVEKTIDRDWTFQYFPAPDPGTQPAQPAYDDSRWQAIALPHTWSTYETTGDVHPFIRSASEGDDSYWWYGWGWYRKRLTIGNQYAGRLIALEFDGVQKYSKVWVNGVLAGEHKGGYTSFSVDITKHVRFGEPNVIAVEVSNRRDDLYKIPPMTAGNFDVYGGARLAMKASAIQIPADRSGIAVLSVDIVDAAGVHVFGANPPLTWQVSGPATLAAPTVFKTDTEKNGAMEGTLYIDAPVANVLRSTATAGAIKVRVTAPGLEPAEVTLESVAPPDDRVEGIAEPPVVDSGRTHVSRDRSFKPVILAAKSSKKNRIAEIKDDADFQGPDVRRQVEAFVKQRNPGVDTFSAAYRAFIERIVQIVTERQGHMVADDYNFNAHAFNDGSNRPLTVAAQQTALPNRDHALPSRDREGALRSQIKSTFFVPDPLPALAPETYSEFEPVPGVVAERVSYATAYNLRVPAIIYRPKKAPAAKLPAFIVVNGHGGDKYTWYAWYAGMLYARAGGVVLTYDPIGEGERNAQRKDGTRQHDRNVDPPEMARRMAGLMITDIMQAVSYLSARPDVDSKRIAAGGFSMGSFILSIAGAVETRLNSVVLVGGGNLDGPGGYWETSSKKMCQGIPYQSLAFLGDRGAALYDLHAARGATLIWNGAEDEVVSIPKMGAPFFEDLRRRTIALHASDKNVFEFGFTPGASHRPYFLTRPVVLWLEEHLHFPNWTPETIAQMPETHILEWAPAHNVAMDKLYFTESREGGTRALGADFPAIPHDALNALPPERWEREKDKYVYETWLREAKAALERGKDQNNVRAN